MNADMMIADKMIGSRYTPAAVPSGLRPPVMLFLAICWLLAATGIAMAHGGDDHSHGAAEPAPATPGAADLSTHSTTGKVEMLLKYPAAEAGTPVRLRFFLADYATNRPLVGARFVVSSRPRGVTTRGPATMTSPGIYELIATFPADTVYSFVTTLALGDTSEQIELRNIYAGEAAERFLAEHGGAPMEEGGEEGGWAIPAILIGAAVLGLGALVFALRHQGVRNPSSARGTMGVSGGTTPPATGGRTGSMEPSGSEPEKEIR